MAIVTDITRRFDVPHEPGEWFELRRLSWKQLDDNTTAKSKQGLTQLREMGGDIVGGIMKAVTEDDDPEAREALSPDVPAALRKAFTNPLKDYDLGLLLRQGVKAWSYAAPLTPEALDGLDDETARWAGEAIVRFTKGERTEAERGEGSSPSI